MLAGAAWAGPAFPTKCTATEDLCLGLVYTGVNGFRCGQAVSWATTVLGDVPDQPAPGLRSDARWIVGDSIAARSTCRECFRPASTLKPRRFCETFFVCKRPEPTNNITILASLPGYSSTQEGMMEFERLYAIGKDLGMTGAELKRWVDAEIARERDQRLARVKCMRDPLYDVVLGNIEGARPPNDPVSLWSPDRTRSDTRPPSMRGPPTSQLGRPDINDKEMNEVENVASSQTQKLACAVPGSSLLQRPELHGRDPRSRPSVRPLKTCAWVLCTRASTGSGVVKPYPGPLPCWATFQTNRRRAFVPTHAWIVGDSIAARSTCRECVSVPSPRR
ncbi:hypothetical protein HPB52_025466 [Rhipicephalus sanguineus]|uniref:Uncharacterized protein n=1 Tax=Rhipicephalus sanguineus TaxID=34632 RepID=A0A9D4TD07_RHISA|nr:hypothetical protein HPB52_025466 [Rhipicephalus sanguineus]